MSTNIQIIDDVWAIHAPSQGKAPASASGAALNYLIEEDQKQHTPTRDEWLNGWSRTYEKCLDVIAGKSGTGGYDENRTITILGENRRADVQRFQPELIAGKNRIYINVGGGLPQNKTLRAEVVRRWYVDGVLGDPTQPETRRKFMKLTEAGLVDDIYDDEALDEIRAEKENEALASGQFVAPRPEDDPMVHGRVHAHYMKSDEFLKLPPDAQEMFYAHHQIHEESAAPPPPVPPPGGEMPPLSGNSPAAGNPEDMLKSAVQGGEPPPAVGMGSGG